MPKFVIEREVPGAGKLSPQEFRRLFRRSPALYCVSWDRKFNGCTATSPTTRSTAFTSRLTRRPFVNTPAAEASPQTACRRFAPSSIRQRASQRASAAITNQ